MIRPLSGPAYLREALEICQGVQSILGAPAADVTALAEAVRLVESFEAPPLAVVGGEGVGKSTLINSLVGRAVLPTDRMSACTAAPIVVSWHPGGTVRRGVEFMDGSELAGLSADEFAGLLGQHINGDNARGVFSGQVTCDGAVLAGGLTLVDMPGVLGASAVVEKQTAERLRAARAAILVVKDRLYSEPRRLLDEFPDLDVQAVVLNWKDTWAEAEFPDVEATRQRVANGDLGRAFPLARVFVLHAPTVNAPGRAPDFRSAEVARLAAEQADAFHAWLAEYAEPRRTRSGRGFCAELVLTCTSRQSADVAAMARLLELPSDERFEGPVASAAAELKTLARRRIATAAVSWGEAVWSLLSKPLEDCRTTVQQTVEVLQSFAGSAEAYARTAGEHRSKVAAAFIALGGAFDRSLRATATTFEDSMAEAVHGAFVSVPLRFGPLLLGLDDWSHDLGFELPEVVAVRQSEHWLGRLVQSAVSSLTAWEIDAPKYTELGKALAQTRDSPIETAVRSALDFLLARFDEAVEFRCLQMIDTLAHPESNESVRGRSLWLQQKALLAKAAELASAYRVG